MGEKMKGWWMRVASWFPEWSRRRKVTFMICPKIWKLYLIHTVLLIAFTGNFDNNYFLWPFRILYRITIASFVLCPAIIAERFDASSQPETTIIIERRDKVWSHVFGRSLVSTTRDAPEAQNTNLLLSYYNNYSIGNYDIILLLSLHRSLAAN